MFDEKARLGSRNSLDGFGGGFAGRGQDLNVAIEQFVPLLRNLEPVARNLSDPRTGLDRFFRARSARDGAVPGLGLGLSIAERTVTAHGGAVRIASRLGHGTRVVATLPLAVPAALPRA